MDDRAPRIDTCIRPNYACVRVGHVIFLRWFAAPQLGDFAQILGFMAAAKRDVGDLVEVEVVSPGVARPSVEVVRAAFGEVKALRYLRRLHVVVIEGDSIERVVSRGVYNALSFVLAETLATADSVDEALVNVCAVAGEDVDEVKSALAEADVLYSTS
jgi:hypothetical protein